MVSTFGVSGSCVAAFHVNRRRIARRARARGGLRRPFPFSWFISTTQVRARGRAVDRRALGCPREAVRAARRRRDERGSHSGARSPRGDGPSGTGGPPRGIPSRTAPIGGSREKGSRGFGGKCREQRPVEGGACGRRALAHPFRAPACPGRFERARFAAGLLTGASAGARWPGKQPRFLLRAVALPWAWVVVS